MNKLFIDIGANDGQTLKYFYSGDWIKNPNEYKYIALLFYVFQPLARQQFFDPVRPFLLDIQDKLDARHRTHAELAIECLLDATDAFRKRF